uniref:Uncharacterized protein n=1 Tax=Rangifer tarandus platyrhynchus TaxID=3082113 RepID=A0ACB0EFW2_RANTA|nr:unnamed protein product [Rangifer tarandus platyrhynchus]
MSDGAGASESGSDQDGLRVQPRGAQSKARSRTTKPSLPPRGQATLPASPPPCSSSVGHRGHTGAAEPAAVASEVGWLSSGLQGVPDRSPGLQLGFWNKTECHQLFSEGKSVRMRGILTAALEQTDRQCQLWAPCFRAPCTQRSAWSSAVKAAAPPDAAWHLSWPSGQKQPDASQLHRPRTCASARPASSELRGLVSVMENSEKQGRQSPNSKWGATSMHKAGLENKEERGTRRGTTMTWEVGGHLPAAYLSDSNDDDIEEARLL